MLLPRVARLVSFCVFAMVVNVVARLAPAAVAAEPVAQQAGFRFKRGINISHWLSQNFAERPYAADWFDAEDVEWIAKQGFDHIRFPVDGRLWLKADGSLDEAKIVPFEKAMKWARERGLGAILDMHFLPGASFDPGKEESAVFTDGKLQASVADFWRKVAVRFAKEGLWLRFEVLNEPVAEKNEQLNVFNRVMLAAIRESNPTRMVYLTSNRWSAFRTVGDVVLPDDPYVALTLHCYEPFVFTHQRASWARYPANMPAISFPGRVPDLSKVIPADHFSQSVSNTQLTVTEVDAAFAKVAAWVEKNAAGREIHVGEFGVYEVVDAESKRTYIQTVRAAAERRGWGWAVWDYQGGFAVRDVAGRGTPVLEGLVGR